MTPPEPEPEAITSITDYCEICNPHVEKSLFYRHFYIIFPTLLS